MSVVVNINQDPNKVKKIGLKFLANWTLIQNQYYGVPDQICVIDTYKGDEDIRNQLFVLYSRKKLGRGMSFRLDDNYNAELVLNYPATKTDIEMFFKFIHDYCINFKTDSFVLEGDMCTLKQIPELTADAIEFNQKFVKTGIEPGLTIFGCIYPIAIEGDLIAKMQSLDNVKAYELFEEYLDQKQKQDCYYAKPLVYQTKDEKYLARYALTEDVPSIFPIRTYLPYGYDQKVKEKIKNWSILLVKNQSGQLQVAEEIEYSHFCKAIEIERYAKFDALHCVVTFNKGLLDKVTSYKINLAKEELALWLADARELGKRPVKIEYTYSFQDENEIKCHIFKYKKTLLGKWYQGVVSDSGTFSEMKEYNKNTEVEDAKHTLRLLQEIWKKNAKNFEQ